MSIPVDRNSQALSRRSLQAISATAPIVYLDSYLSEKRLSVGGEDGMRRLLFDLWFRGYKRDGRARGADSSAFEHVFVGEIGPAAAAHASPSPLQSPPPNQGGTASPPTKVGFTCGGRPTLHPARPFDYPLFFPPAHPSRPPDRPTCVRRVQRRRGAQRLRPPALPRSPFRLCGASLRVRAPRPLPPPPYPRG